MALDVLLDMRLAGYRGGGISRYATELHRALQALPDISIRGLRSQRDPAMDPTAIRVCTPPHHRLETLTIPVELIVRRARPDVYHAPDFIVPLLPGMPKIATVHDLAFLDAPADLAPDALRYYQQLDSAKRRTAAWIVPSHWTACQLCKHYRVPGHSVHVIPHGVSLDLLDADPLHRSARADFVLAVGTVEPRKRYDLLLDALAADATLPHVVIVGGSGWNASVTESRLRQEQRVTWVHNADDAKLRCLYREAIALVMPSRAEGFGLPALEAMACGTPVISSGGGALPEVTAEAAIEVDTASSEAWAAAISQLVSDSDLWQTLSSAGRRRATDFSWSAAAQQTAAVYRSTVGK